MSPLVPSSIPKNAWSDPNLWGKVLNACVGEDSASNTAIKTQTRQTKTKQLWGSWEAFAGVGQFVGRYWVLVAFWWSGVVARMFCTWTMDWVVRVSPLLCDNSTSCKLLTDRGEGRGALQLNGWTQLPWLVVAGPVGGWGPWGSTVRWGRIGSRTGASMGGVHKGTIRGSLGINWSQ